MTDSVPKLLVFDLDGCVWEPEMYELIGNGGSPFTINIEDGNLTDTSGNLVELMGDVRKIMHGKNICFTQLHKYLLLYPMSTNLLGSLWENCISELKCDPKWSETIVAIASKCNEPNWAHECLDKFELPDKVKLRSVFREDLIEIYYGNKQKHLKAIATKTGVDLADMIFFDNQIDNCSKSYARILFL